MVPQKAVVNSKHKIIKERISKLAPITKKAPVSVTNISTELTPEQIHVIKKLKGTGIGKYFAILGNGPSLADIDTAKLKNIESLYLCTVNVPDDRCWPTQYWSFYDRTQYHRHKEIYKTYSGILLNSTAIKEPAVNSIKFRNIPGIGFSNDPSKGIYIGMSSVYATLQIAAYIGFNRIYVLGCDMNNTVDVGRTHFYGVNPDVNPNERKKRFEKEANWYNHMAEYLEPSIKNKIVFCSKGINPWPFVNSFNSVTPSETVDFITKEIQNGW